MSNDFLKLFVEKPVRETGGPRASNRFDYQKNWSLCELLMLHSNYSNYLMVFEHHDDIVVFDSQENPTDATFYQVKTQAKGNWTVGALTKSKDASQSILGKLYANHLTFSDNVKNLVFTSNQPLSAKLKNGEKSIDLGRVKFSDLSDKEKEKIQKDVEPDEQKYCDIAGLGKIVTEKNELRLADHTAITKGKLVEFFEKLHPESEVHISLVYKTFFDEIRRKTNYENPISKVSDLFQHKSIGRSDFESMIGAVVHRRSDNDLWNEANSLLTSEGFSFMQIRKLRSAWQNYVIKKMNVSDESHLGFTEDIKEEICKIDSKSGLDSFKEISENISGALVANYGTDYSKVYINAAILYEVLSDDPISKTNKEFTEEAK